MLVSATSTNAILGGQQLAQAVDVSATHVLIQYHKQPLIH